MTNRTENSPKPDWRNQPQPMVGNYFHAVSHDGRKIKCCGRVVAKLELGWYLVQVFTWLTARNSHRLIVKMEDMQNWLFYANMDDLKFSEHNGIAREGGQFGKYLPKPKLAGKQS